MVCRESAHSALHRLLWAPQKAVDWDVGFAKVALPPNLGFRGSEDKIKVQARLAYRLGKGLSCLSATPVLSWYTGNRSS